MDKLGEINSWLEWLPKEGSSQAQNVVTTWTVKAEFGFTGRKFVVKQGEIEVATVSLNDLIKKVNEEYYKIDRCITDDLSQLELDNNNNKLKSINEILSRLNVLHNQNDKVSNYFYRFCRWIASSASNHDCRKDARTTYSEEKKPRADSSSQEPRQESPVLSREEHSPQAVPQPQPDLRGESSFELEPPAEVLILIQKTLKKLETIESENTNATRFEAMPIRKILKNYHYLLGISNELSKLRKACDTMLYSNEGFKQSFIEKAEAKKYFEQSIEDYLNVPDRLFGHLNITDFDKYSSYIRFAISAHQEALGINVKLNYLDKPNRGHGDCLFLSLADLDKARDGDGWRAAISEELRQNKSKYEKLVLDRIKNDEVAGGGILFQSGADPYEQYCNWIGQKGSWGGTPELEVFSLLVGKPVLVVQTNAVISNEPQFSQIFNRSKISADPVVIHNLNENHFQAMLNSRLTPGKLMKLAALSKIDETKKPFTTHDEALIYALRQNRELVIAEFQVDGQLKISFKDNRYGKPLLIFKENNIYYITVKTNSIDPSFRDILNASRLPENPLVQQIENREREIKPIKPNKVPKLKKTVRFADSVHFADDEKKTAS